MNKNTFVIAVMSYFTLMAAFFGLVANFWIFNRGIFVLIAMPIAVVGGLLGIWIAQTLQNRYE